jgi:alpha-tubulin suppressor-like RCC1 family protein
MKTMKFAMLLAVIFLLASPYRGESSSVVAWGYNTHGQIDVPSDLTNAAAIATANIHSLALKSDGSVRAWGYNAYGQINVPQDLTNVLAIITGYQHSLALKYDGSVIGWGDGQTNVPHLTNVVAIASRYQHSLALKNDGTVVGWGDNRFHQSEIPANLKEVVAIAEGFYHALALKNDGTVVGWGNNGYGQTSVPPGLTNVVAIAASEYHSFALLRNGTVVAWGYGLNGDTQTNLPSGLTNVVAIAAGWYHNLALLRDGNVTAWGDNTFGQITIPSGLSNVTAIAAGYSHSLALVGDGTPSITVHPFNQRVIRNHNVTFTVLAVGNGPLHYQWGFNNVPIRGATGSDFTLSGISTNDQGRYSVLITNLMGSTTSSNAILTVLPFNPADFNSDTRPDILWQHDDGRIATWLMSGTNQLQSVPLNSGRRVASAWRIVGQSDFNADGQTDLLWQNNDGRLRVWFLDGTDLVRSTLLRNGQPLPAGWRVTAVGDFNRDDNADFLLRHEDGRIAIWFMNRTNRVSTQMLNGGAAVNSAWQIVATADFDHDGKTDLVWQHIDGWLVVSLMDGVNFRRSFYINNGLAVPNGWHLRGAADFDDNGSKDLLWQTDNGEVALWLMNGTNRLRETFLNVHPVSSGWRIVGPK